MGETYDESVDVYSFSILLLAMAVEGNLTEWFLKRYQASHWHHKSTRNPKKKSPKILKALRMLWEEGWRPYNPDDENNDELIVQQVEFPEDMPWSPHFDGEENPLIYAPNDTDTFIRGEDGKESIKTKEQLQKVEERARSQVTAPYTTASTVVKLRRSVSSSRAPQRVE